MTNIIISLLPFLGTFKNCHTMLFLYLFTYFGAGDQTQSLIHVKHTSYYWLLSYDLKKKTENNVWLSRRFSSSFSFGMLSLDFLNRVNSNCAHCFYFTMNITHSNFCVFSMETTETSRPTRESCQFHLTWRKK